MVFSKALNPRMTVFAEKLDEVATALDGIHNIRRAVEVGSADAGINAHELRPQMIAALERSEPGSHS